MGDNEMGQMEGRMDILVAQAPGVKTLCTLNYRRQEAQVELK